MNKYQVFGFIFVLISMTMLATATEQDDFIKNCCKFLCQPCLVNIKVICPNTIIQVSDLLGFCVKHGHPCAL